MTLENKELLLKDLCARLPYNPLVEYKGESYNVLGIAHGRVLLCKPFSSITEKDCPLVEEVKPYLFPLSSMTDEQENEFQSLNGWNKCVFPQTEEAFDWLNAHHFDYRGLIEKGLAIDTTGLNVY